MTQDSEATKETLSKIFELMKKAKDEKEVTVDEVAGILKSHTTVLIGRKRLGIFVFLCHITVVVLLSMILARHELAPTHFSHYIKADQIYEPEKIDDKMMCRTIESKSLRHWLIAIICILCLSQVVSLYIAYERNTDLRLVAIKALKSD